MSARDQPGDPGGDPPGNWRVLGALASMRFEVQGTGGNCTAVVGTAAGLRLFVVDLGDHTAPSDDGPRGYFLYVLDANGEDGDEPVLSYEEHPAVCDRCGGAVADFLSAPVHCGADAGHDVACAHPVDVMDGCAWPTTLRTDEGVECSFLDFLRDNMETCDGATFAAIAALGIGETYSEPAGGVAAWSVTRVS